MRRLLMLLTGAAAIKWLHSRLSRDDAAPVGSSTPGRTASPGPVPVGRQPRPSVSVVTNSAPMCTACGETMQRAGTGHVCPGCGSFVGATGASSGAAALKAVSADQQVVIGTDDVIAAVVRKAVGPTVADRVLADLPTREALRVASDERLLAIKGLGAAKLARLRAHVDTDLESLLAGVKGLGPAKRNRILETFGTAQAFLLASDDDLAAIDGIGPALRKALVERRNAPEAFLN